jgi:hypothetical protein
MVLHLVVLFAKKPRSLLLIDAAGALVSAFMLGIVLPGFEQFFGIPTATLYVLAILPLGFVLFDLLAYGLGRSNMALCLRIISVLNLLYVLLSLASALLVQDQLKWPGMVYLAGELCLVAWLAVLEWKLAGAIRRRA